MLIGMELIREVVETTILTGRVKGSAPVSLLLIASPESGKTSVVLAKECAGIIALSDVTGRGLQELCKNHPEVSHIVINDLVAVAAHKATVSRYTMSMLNAMTEEGIRAVAFPGQLETFSSGKRGIIASIPTTMAKDGRAWWNKIGLSSRMLPLCFKHSTDLNIQIKAMITSGKMGPSHSAPNQVFKIPSASIAVFLPTKQAKRIQEIAEDVGMRMQEEGYRRLHQFRALAQGHALLRTWRKPSVTEADIEFLLKLRKYISYSRAREI